MLILPPTVASSAIESQKARLFDGQDLHLEGTEVVSYQLSTGEHTLLFRNGFSMSIGANQFSSDSAVVWLKSKTTEFRGRTRIDYNAKVYLTGNITVKKGKGARTTDLETFLVPRKTRDEQEATRYESMVVRFSVSGEVFVTADIKKSGDPRGLVLYKKALADVTSLGLKFAVKAEVPVSETADSVKQIPVAELADSNKVKSEKTEIIAKPKVKKPGLAYPVNIAPAGEVKPKVEISTAADGTDIATVIGRFYLWQKQDEKGGLLELQADDAVMFLADSGQRTADSKEPYAKRYTPNAVYMSGDVVMTEGQRTIRADELYYDFQEKKALAINAVMRNFDVKRGIPIYVRAAKLRQLAENKFAAENITLTSSEFYQPQISLTASTVLITDTTAIDQRDGKVSDSSFDAQMRDVRLKMGKRTIFYWPVMRSNLQRPDIPIKSIRIGNDNTWGTSVETRWYLSRLLGLAEPEGTDSTFALDYYGKRGLGSGVEIDYERENYFGRFLGYLISDTGKDRLGRDRSRKDIEPDRKLRGRFHWLHRQFLPYNWQLTTETSYASDENFIEGYYRGEFNVGKEQETLIHLKRLEDNWALSLLGKGRINDFVDKLEELPSVEFHLTGQSLFDDRFTLYSDTEVSRLRQRIGEKHSTVISDEQFSFVSHRTELDMPIMIADSGQRIADRKMAESGDSKRYTLNAKRYFKIVPFVAGTFGYDDRSGFTRTLVDGSNKGGFGEDKIWIGEAGVRVFSQYWKVYPDVKSRLWDLNQLRHIIEPKLTAVVYTESDSVVKQRDTLNIGISQRLQTKRGPAGRQRNVDWMRLDMDVTWVNNSSHDAASSGPDRFIWNNPAVPLRVLSAPEIFNGDLSSGLRRFEMFGPRRNYFSADAIFRLSDTSAVLSDMN
ncbi:MAG TPA: LPS-assembly protein LptD, partial [Phycisphaerales bacterium]|nr:LPS-assembly protein LptD [Phycisphaerales bacterium]